MNVREVRTRFDKLLKRFGEKEVNEFTVDYSPILWALTSKAATLETVDQVEDLVLGALCSVHLFCGDDPCLPTYPDEYNVEETLRWEVVNREEKPFLLSEFLTQRIGTCTTFTLVALIVLHSTRDCGKMTICVTNRTNLVKPSHVWLRMEDGRIIDLLSRSQGQKPFTALKPDREIGIG